MRRLDLRDQKFGRLTALYIAGRDKWGSIIWRCRCDCGNQANVSAGKLRSDDIRSCGCLAREGNHLTHGDARKGKVCREWRIWSAMKSRCYNQSVVTYKDYGGRGIKVCARWLNSFSSFLADMGRCPVGKGIERINNDGNYEPGNCKWATSFEQNNNKRNVVKITFRGKTLTRSQWDLEMGYPVGTVARRIQEGCATKRALTLPYRKS